MSSPCTSAESLENHIMNPSITPHMLTEFPMVPGRPSLVMVFRAAVMAAGLAHAEEAKAEMAANPGGEPADYMCHHAPALWLGTEPYDMIESH